MLLQRRFKESLSFSVPPSLVNVNGRVDNVSYTSVKISFARWNNPADQDVAPTKYVINWSYYSALCISMSNFHNLFAFID